MTNVFPEVAIGQDGLNIRAQNAPECTSVLGNELFSEGSSACTRQGRGGRGLIHLEVCLTGTETICRS